MDSFYPVKCYILSIADYIQGRVILPNGSKELRVVLEGGLYSRAAGSVTGFTVPTICP